MTTGRVALLGAPGAGTSTLAAALAALAGGAVEVRDAPGAPDLAGDRWEALRPADAVVLVVSPVQGLDPRTVADWEACGLAGLPRVVVLSALDRPGADADEAVALCQRLLGEEVLPLALPLHDDDGSVGGLLDLVGLRVVDATAGEERAADPEHVRLVEPLREELAEAVLTGSDDEAAFAAFAAGDVDAGALARELPEAVVRGDLQPVLVALPATGLGLAELLALLRAVLERAPAALADDRPGPLPRPQPQLPVGVRDDPGLEARVAADPVARLAVDPRTGQRLLWAVGPEHAERLLAGLPSAPVRVEGAKHGRVLVTAPSWALRAVRSDLLSRGGEVLAVEEDDEQARVEARLPAAELPHYALALARVTSHTASFTRLSGPLSPPD